MVSLAAFAVAVAHFCGGELWLCVRSGNGAHWKQLEAFGRRGTVFVPEIKTLAM